VVREYVSSIYLSALVLELKSKATIYETLVANVPLLSQGKKKRQHGNDAVKSHILAARTVANIVRTSLVGNAESNG